MRKLIPTIIAAVALLAAAPAGAHDEDEPEADDFCHELLGFEGDGGPVFVVVDEDELEESGKLVGPPPGVLPIGFVPTDSDTAFEYRGTIAAGETALRAADIDACEEPVG